MNNWAKTKHRFSLFIVGMFFAISLQASCIAAELTVSKDEGCALHLKGKIVAGDFERFEALTGKLKLADMEGEGELENNTDQALCLDSPGGSYLEGRKISQFVHDHAIGTRILADSGCFSACAFIFMAGRIRGAEFDALYRHLHIGGKLGFHAPYLDLEDAKQYTGNELEEAIALYSLVIADFIEFGSFSSQFSYQPDFPMSLISQLLAADRNEVVMVDTVEAAARWNVSLDGVHEEWSIGKSEAVQTCVNFQAWVHDKSSNTDEGKETVEYLLQQDESFEVGKIGKFELVQTGGMEDQHCHVEVPPKPSSGFLICVRDDFSGRHFGDCPNNYGIWIPGYFSLPPGTSITKLGIKQ